MKTYQLSGPDLLEPFWFNRVRHGQHPSIVSAEGDVQGVSEAGRPVDAQ